MEMRRITITKILNKQIVLNNVILNFIILDIVNAKDH